ncbi:hypothetical protein HQ590_14280 [bacterium]|nr:hypothetical protein [bacterium]
MTTEPNKLKPPQRKPLQWVRPASRIEKPAGSPGDTPLKPLQARDKLTVKRPGATLPAGPERRWSAGQRALILLVIVVVIAGGGWLSLVVLTPTYGKIVGYADQQPPLELIQPPLGQSPPQEVNRIRGIAQLQLEDRTDLENMYWPEPCTIVERPNCWLVAYARRVPIREFLGFRQVVVPTDKYMFLSIDKEDLSLRFGKWCE